VADKVRFLEDTRDIEVFAEPEITLSFGAGDCDDQSILISALLESAGFRTQLVAVGQSDYEHVYVRADYPKPPAPKIKTIAFDLSVPHKQFNYDPAQVETFNKIKIVDID
jgi:transglutaminase-like putative cysteine protease